MNRFMEVTDAEIRGSVAGKLVIADDATTTVCVGSGGGD